MVRYAQKGAVDQTKTKELIDGLTARKYPLIEEVDGRVYFHLPKASARDIALLTLWHKHPGRTTRPNLVAAIVRHRFKVANATMAVSRLGGLVDQDAQHRLRLLQPGMRIAEQLIESAEPS